MARSLWLAFALVALGLWASLVPQVTYPSASSGELSNDVLTAWPGWGVQQDLGPLSGTVGNFQIWAASRPDAEPRQTVIASLLDAQTGDVLRQTTIDLTPSPIPVLRTLDFPAYDASSGQRLLLQLQVTELENYPVSYRLAHPKPGYANVIRNDVADAGEGPLAFTHRTSSSGLRAALHGQPAARFWLALAAALSILAALTHPRVAGGLRRASTAVQRRTRRATAAARRLAGPDIEAGRVGPPTTLGRVMAAPWYPWPAAVIPILHFLASNPLHFAVHEVGAPIGAALLIVSGCMVGLRLLFKDWRRAAAATIATIVIVFGFGHVERILDGQLDERILFGGAVVLVGAAVAAAARQAIPPARWTRYLNLVVALLLVFPTLTLAGRVVAPSASVAPTEAAALEDLTAHLSQLDVSNASGRRPDIYYIILDAYSRHDALGGFDNSDFLRELDRRGFYVAEQAVSNYVRSMESITSSLNMSFIENLAYRNPGSDPYREENLLAAGRHNALAAILKRMGYTYLHLESGYPLTDSAPLADSSYVFTAGGVLQRSGNSVSDTRTTQGFLHKLTATTALRPIFDVNFFAESNRVYDWWFPTRTIQMFDVLTNQINVDQPAFVFAHFVKPHEPFTFDRLGNHTVGESEHDSFDDDHDPSVPSAYIGQLLYMNSSVLKMIDGILDRSGTDPIIILASDHGNNGGPNRHSILAAFHLPGGGDSGLYPSISSVNHFRYVLDYYFGLGLGLLEDRVIERG